VDLSNAVSIPRVPPASLSCFTLHTHVLLKIFKLFNSAEVFDGYPVVDCLTERIQSLRSHTNKNKTWHSTLQQSLGPKRIE